MQKSYKLLQQNQTMQLKLIEEQRSLISELISASSQNNFESLLEQFYDRKVRQQRIEDTHSKRTFYIENELLLKLDKLCQDEQGKQINGMKTFILNKSLKIILEE